MVISCVGSLLPALLARSSLLPTAAIVPRSFSLCLFLTFSRFLRTTTNLVKTDRTASAALYELLKHPTRSILRANFAIAINTSCFAFLAAATMLGCCTLVQPESMRLEVELHALQLLELPRTYSINPQATPCPPTPLSPVTILARHNTHCHVIRA
jgi:hypothetical protein